MFSSFAQKNVVGHMYRMHIGVKVQNQITPSSDREHTSASASYMRNNLHTVMYISFQEDLNNGLNNVLNWICSAIQRFPLS